MGIGTLIIFIATILVAAVAAGVLISTSGVLQQRALITGQEARTKITNAVEIISITAAGNKTTETLNNFAILMRLDAGSDPLQMKRFDLAFIGENLDASASLQHPIYNDPINDPKGFNDMLIGTDIVPWNWNTIRDLDNDGRREAFMMYTPDNSSYYILFNLTKAGFYLYNMTSLNLTRQSADTYLIDIVDQPIIGQDGFYYGYFHIKGTNNMNRSINVTSCNFNITSNPYECSFDSVAPERRYCYYVMHGDEDLVLGNGEMLELRYKLRHYVQPEKNLTLENGSIFLTLPAINIDDSLGIQESFRFIMSAEKGRLTQAEARTPDIIQTKRVPLWPVG